MTLASRLRAAIDGVPEEGAVTLPVGVVEHWLEEEDEEGASTRERPTPAAEESTEPASWRERLWTCPPETRLDLEAAAEALGRPKSALYKLTSADEIPHRKAAGSLVFVASELRDWIRANEEILVPGSAGRRRLREVE